MDRWDRFRCVSLVCLALLASLLALPAPAHAAEAYRAYADGLLDKPPAGTKLRPDLETVLDKLAAGSRGKTQLKVNDRLKRAARAQALDMALGNYVGHQSRNGYRFGQRFAAFADVDSVGLHGENAARDRRSGPVDAARARRLFGQWLESSGHRRNLLNPAYAYVSTGAVQLGNHLYAVQIFWQYEAPPGEPAATSSKGTVVFY